ncbi:hypothetical protein FRX31_016003 [Thalictrum thalictroides]|uniref:Uncharacterized protein n=1 Tax=Thalictrum thalictroides TaxID=46969 RepID=A0A7J6WAL4_THATH|nr:hypothetical protein FRX31_016003 [Thalictrum thalictroides]
MAKSSTGLIFERDMKFQLTHMDMLSLPLALWPCGWRAFFLAEMPRLSGLAEVLNKGSAKYILSAPVVEQAKMEQQ